MVVGSVTRIQWKYVCNYLEQGSDSLTSFYTNAASTLAELGLSAQACQEHFEEVQFSAKSIISEAQTDPNYVYYLAKGSLELFLPKIPEASVAAQAQAKAQLEATRLLADPVACGREEDQSSGDEHSDTFVDPRGRNPQQIYDICAQRLNIKLHGPARSELSPAERLVQDIGGGDGRDLRGISRAKTTNVGRKRALRGTATSRRGRALDAKFYGIHTSPFGLFSVPSFS